MADDDQTYDLVIEDAEPGEIGDVLGGLSTLMASYAQAMQHHPRQRDELESRLDRIDALIQRIIRENPETMRGIMLDRETEVVTNSLSKELLAELDIGVDDEGKPFDLRGHTKIDIE